MKNKSTLMGIFSIGLFFSLILSGLMLKYEYSKAEKAFVQEMRRDSESIKQKFLNLQAADEKIRFIFQTYDDVSDDDFLVHSNAVFSQIPYVKKIVFAPKIRREFLELEEIKLQNEGYTGFKFRPFSREDHLSNSKKVAEENLILNSENSQNNSSNLTAGVSSRELKQAIFPVRFIEPLTPYTFVWFGRDLTTHQSFELVLDEVIQSNERLRIVRTDYRYGQAGGGNAGVSDIAPVYYALSAVSFVEDGNEHELSNANKFADVFGVLVYELDLNSLLTENDNSRFVRKVILGGHEILNQLNQFEESIFSLRYQDVIRIENQSLPIQYVSSSQSNLIEYRIPVLILLLGLLISSLVLFSIRNSFERHRLLSDQKQQIEKKVKEKTALLEGQAEQINRAFDHQLAVTRELESFSYSISHDLRAPLRSISGFANALNEDYADKLDEVGTDMLARIEKGAGKMSVLIDDLLSLSKISRQNFTASSFSISELAKEQVKEICENGNQYGNESSKNTVIKIASNVEAIGDRNLVRIVLNNLIGNAIKYSAKAKEPTIEFGVVEKNGKPVYFVRDNGVGFDMNYANKLFVAFQRLHGDEYEGTGIGLATVQRVVNRHGGKIWAESEVGKGSTFYFSLS